MKTNTFLLFIICSLFLSAQEKNAYILWQENYDKGVELYKQNNFTDAIPFFENAKDYINQLDFSTDLETQYYPAYNYDHLGACYYQTNQFNKAAAYYMSALNALQSLENPDLDYAKRMLNAVVFSFEKYAPDKAIQFLDKVLDSIKSSGDYKTIDYAELLFTKFQVYKGLKDSEGMLGSLEQAYAIHKEIGSTNHQQYPFIIFNLAYTYYFSNNYFDALIYFKETDAFIDFYKTQNWINIGKLNYDYGVCYFEQNNFAQAEKKFKTVINDPWLLKVENTDFNIYANNNLGLCLYYQNKFDEAKTVYNNSINYLSSVLEKTNPWLALQKTNFTKILIYLEDYAKALELSHEVYETLGSADLTNERAYSNAVNNLGLLYMNNSDFIKAEEFLKKTLNILQSNSNPDLLDIARIQGNLGAISQKRGRYEDAKKWYNLTLESQSQLLSPNSPEYANALKNYASFLFETGEYFKAEEYLMKSLKIVNRNKENPYQTYGELQLSLATIYSTTGRQKESLSAYNNALEFYEKNGGIKSEFYAIALMGKAFCLLSLKDYSNALKNAEYSHKIIKEKFGEASHQYANASVEYGQILNSLGRYKEAGELMTTSSKYIMSNLDNIGLQSFEVIADYQIDEYLAVGDYEAASKFIETYELFVFQKYGFESYEYGRLLEQKLKIWLHNEEYDYAYDVFENIKRLYKNSAKEDKSTYNNLIFKYAKALDKGGKREEAQQAYQEFFEGLQNRLKDVFTYRSESDKKLFLKELSFYSDWLNATIFNTTKVLKGTGLNNQLMLKSLLLNASKEIISNLSRTKDTSILAKVDRYSSVKLQLADPIVLKDKNRSNALRTELNNLETELVKIHDEKFGSTTNTNFNRDWIKIKDKLKPNEAAIEFVEFETREGNLLSGKRAYGAFLLTSNSENPEAVQLFMARDLKTILKNQTPNTLYQTRGSKSKSTTNTKGLYDLIWSPLEPYLEGIETIYFSPTGLLNQIPFAAMDIKDKPILAEQFNLVQLSSTYSLTEKKTAPKSENTLFVGGIDYEFVDDHSSTTKEEEYSQLSMLKSASGTRSMGTKWNYLPGTLEEVNAIEGLFKAKNKSISILSSKEATETAFKNLSGKSPSTIHIATHGFFFENPKATEASTLEISGQNIYKASEDPLLRSGLIFAGANEAWTKGANSNSEDDGILTALEISNLDLSNTDLVVLSACETGLGDIDGSEGVYGLQRAFKMAGVDLIIMSLWEVPDAETAEFMKLFYNNWLNGENVRKAFRDTQLTMSNKYKDQPEKWAAFVLFE